MEARVIKNEITPTMQEMARQFPEYARRAAYSLGMYLRKQVAAQSGAGMPAGHGWQSLNRLTVLLRQSRPQQLQTKFTKRSSKKAGTRFVATRKLSTSRPFGGRLFGPPAGEYGLVEFKVDQKGQDWSVGVGFFEGVFKGATRRATQFQQATSNRNISKFQHQMLREKLGRQFRQPREWPAKPERNVFQPYADNPATKEDAARVFGESITRLRDYAIEKARKTA